MDIKNIDRPFDVEKYPKYIIYSDFICLKCLSNNEKRKLRIKDKWCDYCLPRTIKISEIKKHSLFSFFSIEVGINVLLDIEKIVQFKNDYKIEKKFKDDLKEYLSFVPSAIRQEYLCSKSKDLIYDYILSHSNEILVGQKISSIITRTYNKYKRNYTPKDFIVIKKWFEKYNQNKKITQNSIIKFYLQEYDAVYKRRKNNHIRNISIEKLFGYHSYRFDLSQKDFAIIIGTNGLGKTTIFNLLEGLLVGGKSSVETQANFRGVFEIPFNKLTVTFDNGEEIIVDKSSKKRISIIYTLQPGEINQTTFFVQTNTKQIGTNYIECRNGKNERLLIECSEDKILEHYYYINHFFPMLNTGNSLARFHFIRTRRDDFKDREQIYNRMYKEISPEQFKHFQEIIEGLYYEEDPSKKTIAYNKNGELVVRSTNDLEDYQKEDFSLEKLSSGEINVIVILFDLLFRCVHDSIILIDEPEISLHIAWQQYLGEIIKRELKWKKGAQVIMATHSPFIAAGDTSLLVEAEPIKED